MIKSSQERRGYMIVIRNADIYSPAHAAGVDVLIAN